ncbi:MAG: AAA family ATPase [Clostridia bacterium]|nr:AAA family ATPase [Clostridia bacterium]
MEQYELAYFEDLCAFLDAEIRRLKDENRSLQREMREAGKRLAENDPYAALYGTADGNAHLDEMERRAERSGTNDAEAAFLEKLRLAPYFGRVDFAENGGDLRRIYIGLRTLVRRQDLAILTYDWRAPVSSLFYVGEVGNAAYQAPAGEVRGAIRRIRQYRFQDGRLAECWDADLRIDDEVLRGMLSGASSERMKVIVSTIQRDQNRAVRANAKKSLAVFGPAGCGKTSIGMHRLAWLMYEARAAQEKPDILMFTGNEAFAAYVAGVLPELGEEEIRTCAYADLFTKHLKGFSVAPVLSLTEALLAGNREREQYVRAVYDEAFADFVRDALSVLPARFRTLSLFGEPVVTAQTLKEKYAGLSAPNVGERLAVLKRWTRDEIRRYFRQHKKEIYAAVFHRTGTETPTDAAFDRLRNTFLRNADAGIDAAVLTDAPVLFRRFFAAYYGETEMLAALKDRLERKKLRFEDGVMLLYIKAALGLCRETPPTHILLDEAQDYAPLQHRTLRLMYPKTVFTVLADVNQGIVPAADTLDADRIARIYGAAPLVIAKSYRNTRQIGEFAKRYLPGADYELFDRDGPEPAFHEAGDAAAAVPEIVKGLPERYRSVCVILGTVRETKQFYRKLLGYLPHCAAVTDEGTAIGARVLCMPVALTKGLEFDAVIIPAFEKAEKNSRVAYMMTTRALHELHLIRGKKKQIDQTETGAAAPPRAVKPTI